MFWETRFSVTVVGDCWCCACASCLSSSLVSCGCVRGVTRLVAAGGRGGHSTTSCSNTQLLSRSIFGRKIEKNAEGRSFLYFHSFMHHPKIFIPIFSTELESYGSISVGGDTAKKQCKRKDAGLFSIGSYIERSSRRVTECAVFVKQRTFNFTVAVKNANYVNDSFAPAI